MYVLALDDELVLVMPTQQRADEAMFDFAAMTQNVGSLLAATLRRNGVQSGELYELSPASRAVLKGSRRDEVGSYFRGVLRDDTTGKVTHQVQLREARAVPAPRSPVDVAIASQLAAIQAQLTRMEDKLDDLAIALDEVGAFLERQQRATVVAALTIIGDVHRRALKVGTLSDTDWQRLAGVELALETQLHAVTDELRERLGGQKFTGRSPADALKTAKKISPKRTAELLAAQRVLLGGLRRWHELSALRRCCDGSLDADDARALSERLEALMVQHEQSRHLAARLADEMKTLGQRSVWQRLFKDGLVIGARNDKRDLNTLSEHRRTLKAAAKAPTPALRAVHARRALAVAPAPPPATAS